MAVLLAAQSIVCAEEPALENAPAANAAQPGVPLAVDLGQGVSLPFVWIQALKMWVGKFEITNEQFERFNAGHESEPFFGNKFDAPEQPVVYVSWEDANNYCGWLNRNFGALAPAGYEFRLPTENEWQVFARCGDNRVYPWGNQWPPPDDWNYRGKEGSGLLYKLFQDDRSIRGHDDGFIVGCPVSRSGVNSWGLYGVGGNVWEWCADWFDAERATKVLRGGAWNNYEPNILAVTNRSDANPEWKNPMIGFRVTLGPCLGGAGR